MSLQPGETILNGKYRIVEFLGKGAFAHVYRAHHEALKRDVAVKVLRRDMEGADSTRLEEYRQRFQLEAELGAQFDDPHLVKVYDFEEEDGALYLVMEYCPGGSLEKRLEKGPLSVEEAVRMMREVAQGLALLHGHRPQIVHRDLKPSNILLGADGVWKVADLGLSQVPRRTSVRSVLGSEAERHPGTPEYMSPEQEETVGYLQPPSDVWALGAVAFEALTGRLYKEERPGVRVRELREDVPGWLDELVARCLAKEKEARPWDGGEVVALLAGGLAQQSERQTRAVQRVLVHLPLPAWAWAGLGGLLMLLMVGGVLWWGGRGGRGSVTLTPPSVAGVTRARTATMVPVAKDTPSPMPAHSTDTVTVPPSTRGFTPMLPTATASLTRTPSHTPLPTATPAPFAVVMTETLNVRAGPGIMYEPTGIIHRGEQYQIVGRVYDGGWLLVCCPGGREGWVSASFVRVAGDVGGVKVVTDLPPTPTPRPLPTATPTPEVAFYRIGFPGNSSLDGYAEQPPERFFVNGIPFCVPKVRGQVWTSQAELFPSNPENISIHLGLTEPKAVFVLFSGGDTYTMFDRKQVGDIILRFSDGRSYTRHLFAGVEMRDWVCKVGVICTTESPDVKEVWRSRNRDEPWWEVIIDMLVIDIPLEYRNTKLMELEVRDVTNATVSSKSPAINLVALTVQGRGIEVPEVCGD